MDTIRDGKGKGYLAAVNFENMLLTRSMTVSHGYHHTIVEESSFMLGFQHIIQETGVDEIIGYFTYTGESTVIISSRGMNTNSAGLSIHAMSFNPTGLSGGEDIAPLNLNLGSKVGIKSITKNTANGTSPISYTDIGNKMGAVFMGYHNQMNSRLDIKESVALPTGSTIAVVCNSTAGDIVNAGFIFFEDHTDE